MGRQKNIEVQQDDVLKMLKNTSRIAADKQVEQLQIVANAYKSSKHLVENTEFWSWMNRNYSGADGFMFSSNEAMKQYLSKGQAQYEWMRKQVQGKGYEWDWMQKQRNNIKNIFKTYNAGDVSNQAAIDVTEHNFVTRTKTDYQMKAYISKNNPDLHNTGTDINVVTNSEKVEVVKKNGYVVESYKDRDEIIADIDSRMNDVKDGIASPKYTFKNISGAMAKSGIIGCMFGMGTEAILAYKQWERDELSDEEYLSEIVKAGGDAGITAASTTGIMIPVSAIVTGAGASSLITIPIAFVVSVAVNSIVAPCFGRGKYRKILNEAYYYQRLENMYQPFIKSIYDASNEYVAFAEEKVIQEREYLSIKRKDQIVTQSLKNLYDSI